MKIAGSMLTERLFRQPFEYLPRKPAFSSTGTALIEAIAIGKVSAHS
jgi:hypothetical protein